MIYGKGKGQFIGTKLKHGCICSNDADIVCSQIYCTQTAVCDDYVLKLCRSIGKGRAKVDGIGCVSKHRFGWRVFYHEIVNTDIPGVIACNTIDANPMDAGSFGSEAAQDLLVVSFVDWLWKDDGFEHTLNGAFCSVVNAQSCTGIDILSGPYLYVVVCSCFQPEGSHQPSIGTIPQRGIEEAIAGGAVVASIAGVGNPVLRHTTIQILRPYLHRLTIRLPLFKTIRKGIGVDNGIITFTADR